MRGRDRQGAHKIARTLDRKKLPREKENRLRQRQSPALAQGRLRRRAHGTEEGVIDGMRHAEKTARVGAVVRVVLFIPTAGGQIAVERRNEAAIKRIFE